MSRAFTAKIDDFPSNHAKSVEFIGILFIEIVLFSCGCIVKQTKRPALTVSAAKHTTTNSPPRTDMRERENIHRSESQRKCYYYAQSGIHVKTSENVLLSSPITADVST